MSPAPWWFPPLAVLVIALLTVGAVVLCVRFIMLLARLAGGAL